MNFNWPFIYIDISLNSKILQLDNFFCHISELAGRNSWFSDYIEKIVLAVLVQRDAVEERNIMERSKMVF